MCFFINKRKFIEFNEPTYQKALSKLENYLNENFKSQFKIIGENGNIITKKTYFKVENINKTHKMKIEYKLKYIERYNSIGDLSKLGLLTFNNSQYNYYKLKVYLDIKHTCLI
jgi:hypothetical protein